MNINKIIYTPDTILNLFKEYRHLSYDAYSNGNIGIAEVIADLNLLLDSANLTDRQRLAFEYYYLKGHTQQETADFLGVSRIAVLYSLEFAERKIITKVKEWA